MYVFISFLHEQVLNFHPLLICLISGNAISGVGEGYRAERP
jgi:hypothetical protein